ncbi:hypothetical protein J0A80_11045, partial [Acinetobacter baumannii]|nr:hypothetical protein [Acinetobacter baumannii]
MLPPVPKTKSSEVTDIINSAVLTGSISEFQYFRCKRLLNDIKETEPLDWLVSYTHLTLPTILRV